MNINIQCKLIQMGNPKNYERIGAILTFIKDYQLAHGQVPTRAEIGKQFGITRQRARAIIQELVESKLIHITKEKTHRNYILNI